jgi:phosphorylcholine metabolism protein LicD
MNTFYDTLSNDINQIPPSFFEDEVREGFFVSSMMKRYWALQLKVLAEIDRICQKHDIRWFADCGTLLGAVRHGGFIPWDDDLDICMLRHEYERFFAVAAQELPKEYCILTVHTEEVYDHMLGRIVNAHSIQYGNDYLKENFGCPYTVGIDIVPLDGLAKDDVREEKRLDALKSISDAAALIEAGELNTPACQSLLADIERTNHTTLHRQGNLSRELVLLAEKLYTMYPSDTADDVVLMPFWVSHHNHRYSKELFARTVMLPFEFTHLPVPMRYDEVLQIEYGNYMITSKKGGIHEYPVYKQQEDLLRSSLGGNPFRYTMPHKLPEPRKKKSLQADCLHMISALKQAHCQIGLLCEGNDFASAGLLLQSCQTLAVSLGTMLEEQLHGSESVVHILENYCELVYRSSGEWCGEESLMLLNDEIEHAKHELEELFLHPAKEILFLPCKAEWWRSMEPEWEKACGESSNNVFVMPIPYLLKDFCGKQRETHDDSALFPDYVKLTALTDYDIVKRHPDVIYIQNPFDGFNSVFLIPEFFYAQNLKLHTKELIYLPCYEPDAPEADDSKFLSALSVMVEQPAVYHADRIIVNTEEIKNVYAAMLSEITGSSTRGYWESKLSVSDAVRDAKDEKLRARKALADALKIPVPDKKILLFQVNVAFISRYKEEGLRKIKDSLELMKSYHENILCIFSPHESLRCIDQSDLSCFEEWNALLDEVSQDETILFDKEQIVTDYIEGIDGYYGNPGHLAHKCVTAGVPVMIMAIF